MLGSFTNIQSGNYWSALADGQPWRVVEVEVGPDWKTYSVPLDQMSPQGAGSVPPMGDASGAMAHVLIEDAANAELWLEDILLF